MSSLGTRHPTGEQLLLFADGELAAAESEDVRSHLQACWQCRNELEEIERTIGECVRYRKVLDACLPLPPQPWFDIYPRLARMDEAQKRRRLLSYLLEPLAALWSHPRRWVPAVATIVLIAVVVQQLRHTPSVQAAELLRKAIVAADSHPPPVRRIQIRTRTRRLTRVVGSRATSAKTEAGAEATAAIESLFLAVHYSWDDPLSAKSYAEWRDQLADKRDEVTVEPDHYQLRTTTGSGDLLEATLKLSVPDLHAVESTLQFRDHELVEISELPGLPPPSRVAANEEAAAPVSPPHPSGSYRPGQVLVPAATPGDELAVLAALHRLGADLGDPVDVTRSGAEILVTGSGISPGREQEIRQELSALPRVSLRLSSQPPGGSPALDDRTQSRVSVGPGSGPLQTAMENRLGGRAAFEQFADQVFDMTDAYMSRVHALRRLAQRFPPDVELQMTAQERQLLDQIRIEHAQALLQNVAGVEDRIRSALAITLDDGPPVKSSGEWQDETERLFGEARQSEAMLVALLGASPDQIQSPQLPAQVAASLAQLRKRVENYQHLTTGR